MQTARLRLSSRAVCVFIPGVFKKFRSILSVSPMRKLIPYFRSRVQAINVLPQLPRTFSAAAGYLGTERRFRIQYFGIGNALTVPTINL